jgi:hypothetical protein
MKATVFALVTAVLMVFLGGCSSVPIPGAGRYVYQADPPRTVNYPAPAVVVPPASSGSAYAPPAYSPPGPYVNQGLIDRSAATQRATDMNWSIWRTNAMRSLRATEKAWTRITDKRYDRRDLSDVEYLQRWWTARGNDYCARVRAARNGISDRDYRDRCHTGVVNALHQLYAHSTYRHADEGNLALRKALARVGLGFEYPLFR